MGDKLSAGAEKLTGLSLPDFTDVKNLIEEKFSFKFSDLKLPEIPDFGALFMDVIRRILSPIINFTLPGLFGIGESQPLRFALGKMGGVGKGLLSFVDQTGSFTPPPPSRPAGSVTPSSDTMYGERGRNVNVVMGGSTTNNSGTQVLSNRSISPEAGLLQLSSAI